MKVKMLTRHTAPGNRKLEMGVKYDLPDNYAQELIDHGLAVEFVMVLPPEPLPEAKLTAASSGFVATQKIAPQPRTQIYAAPKKKGGPRISETLKKKAEEDGNS